MLNYSYRNRPNFKEISHNEHLNDERNALQFLLCDFDGRNRSSLLDVDCVVPLKNVTRHEVQLLELKSVHLRKL